MPDTWNLSDRSFIGSVCVSFCWLVSFRIRHCGPNPIRHSSLHNKKEDESCGWRSYWRFGRCKHFWNSWDWCFLISFIFIAKVLLIGQFFILVAFDKSKKTSKFVWESHGKNVWPMRNVLLQKVLLYFTCSDTLASKQAWLYSRELLTLQQTITFEMITGPSFSAGILRDRLPGSAPISLQWFKLVLIIQQCL